MVVRLKLRPEALSISIVSSPSVIDSAYTSSKLGVPLAPVDQPQFVSLTSHNRSLPQYKSPVATPAAPALKERTLVTLASLLSPNVVP